MKRKMQLVFVVLILSLVSLWAPDAESFVAGELQYVRIIGHHFSTQVTGVMPGQTVTKDVDDISSSRFLFLFVQVTNPSEKETGVFAHDFLLQYIENNENDRARCLGLGKVEDINWPVPGAYRMEGFVELVGRRPFNLGLVFMIGNGVDVINLYRAGNANPLPYNLGSSRPYSILLINNQETTNAQQVVRCAEASGCIVAAYAARLDRDERGITIRFTPKAEEAAREISSRLMI